MKKLVLKLFISFILFIYGGCIIDRNFIEFDDSIPPAPPSQIYTITGDNWVEIHWEHNRERDLAGYNIYRGYSYTGKYTFIGSTKNNYFVDLSARNGTTYYYAITAYDYSGNESDLSYDVVYDTPRPEGYNQTIFDFRRFPNNAGYDFSAYKVVPYNSNDCDMFFDNDNGNYYMVVWDDSDIQDMGPTNDIYDIDKTPLTGWSPTKDVRLYVGHTYVVWTWDNHFAKFRVKSITPERIVFDWAYQLQPGNVELKTSKYSSEFRKALNQSGLNERLRSRGK